MSPSRLRQMCTLSRESYRQTRATYADGRRYLDAALREVLSANAELYSDILAAHLGRHLAPFAV